MAAVRTAERRRARGGRGRHCVIEQLNIDRLGTGGGGIHCVTQQQPAV
ncbi:hypothetical protein [Streptomyces sp. NPDC059468]